DKGKFYRSTSRLKGRDGDPYEKFRCGAAEVPPLFVPTLLYDPFVADAGRSSMGYIIAIVLLIIVVPLIFMMLSRRTSGAGGVNQGRDDRGVTVSKPSSDEPT